MSTATPENLRKAAALLALVKNMGEVDLRELEPIESVMDAGNKDGVPAAAEVAAGGAGMAMHGGAAPARIAERGAMVGQEGNMADYERFAKELGGFGKALTEMNTRVNAQGKLVKSLIDALAKAEEEEKKEDDKEVEKALRKARIAVRKAESSDEDEKDEAMEKAQGALRSASSALSKAEDDAKSDEDEKEIEKALGDVRAMRSRLKAIETAKATAAAAATTVQPTAASSAEVAMKALLEQVKAQSIDVKDLIKALSHGGAQAPAGTTLAAPPSFAKAAQETSQTLTTKIETAFIDGDMTAEESSVAKSLAGRFALVKAGKYDAELLNQEISMAPANVKSLFI